SLLYEAATKSDLLLVEGVMGLYDGTPSTADLARQFGLPVAIVLDGSAMAQTFGALVLGLRDYPGAPRIAGVIANRINSEGHARLLRKSLPTGVPLLGTLPFDPGISLPERHLGLHQAHEIAELDARIEAAANAYVDSTEELAPVSFASPSAQT